MGLSTESDLISNELLSKIVQDERISMLNSIEDIVLVLIDEIKENPESLDLLEEIKQLKGFDSLIDGFDIMSLADFDKETADKKIQELQTAGKIVHTLEISQ